ncbi:hypothetical protein Dimus_025429 [Dionaea muscipula]
MGCAGIYWGGWGLQGLRLFKGSGADGYCIGYGVTPHEHKQTQHLGLEKAEVPSSPVLLSLYVSVFSPQHSQLLQPQPVDFCQPLKVTWAGLLPILSAWESVQSLHHPQKSDVSFSPSSSVFPLHPGRAKAIHSSLSHLQLERRRVEARPAARSLEKQKQKNLIPHEKDISTRLLPRVGPHTQGLEIGRH